MNPASRRTDLFKQASLSTHPRPKARVAVLVLEKVSKKEIEADGFSTKVNFSLAKIRDFHKLFAYGSNFTEH